MFIRYSLDEGAYKPTKAYRADAGFDLRTPSAVTLHPGESVTIDTGVHFEIPEGYVGFMKSKSGLMTKFNVVCPGGVVDSGYTGSVRVCMRNLNEHAVYIFDQGDKLAQIVFLPIPTVDLEETDSLTTPTQRGTHGFGSTGR